MTTPGSKGPRRRGRQDGQVKLEEEINLNDYQSHNNLLVQLSEDAPTWYQIGKTFPERNATLSSDPSPTGTDMSQLVRKYRSLADSVYRREIQLFTKIKGNSSDERWVESTMKKGTLKDRVAAMSVVVSTNPIHKFYAIDGLMQMAGCSESGSQQTNSRVAQLAAEALEDLFHNTYLPSNRKLITLDDRPLHLYENKKDENEKNGKKKKTKRTLSPRILLLWRFEELVKDKYELFLRQYIARTLKDSLEQHKVAALRSASTLLRSVPEGEATILSLIVNKLGDPEKKVAAAAGHELRKVLQQHPVMQLTIAREVQQLAHRPHLSSRALYNCVTFLNQLKLRPDEGKSKFSLPASLISTYFRLFEVAIKHAKTEKDVGQVSMKGRLLTALLAGVNRAHPYLPPKNKKMEEHVDALYRLVHTAPPAATTQALLLLFHLAVGSNLDEKDHSVKIPGNDEEKGRQDRFYRALYSVLSSHNMIGSGKHSTMFFNLLYKAMKYDYDVSRVVAFAKRIVCTALHCTSAVLAASIFLLNEIIKYHPSLRPCYEEILVGKDAMRILDPSKREPRGALVTEHDESSKADDPRLAPAWDIAMCTSHYHPSVAKFAETIGSIEFAGDPLSDLALAPFLDKFAYRNPKSAERVAQKYKRGESIAERRSGTETLIERHFLPPMNDPSFLQATVNAQDEFFHKFFVERAKRDTLKGIVRHKVTDEDSGDEDEVVATEEKGLDGGFEGYEAHWETDEEEEAFVDSLAQKIIEDSIDVNGPEDLDQEDPDMEGWADTYSDEEIPEDEDNENSEIIDKLEEDSDDMGQEQDSEGESSDEGDKIISEDEDNFMENSEDESEGSEPSFEKDDPNEVQESPAIEDDSESEDFLLEGESSDDSDAQSEPKSNGKTKKKDVPTFAAADEYEEIINKSFNELKRAREREEASDINEAKPESAKKQRRKLKK